MSGLTVEGKPISGAEVLLYLLVSVPLAIGALFLRAFVLTKLWAWFAVPIFHSRLPVLAFGQAIGVLLLFAFLRYEYEDKQPSSKSIWERLANSVLSSLLFSLLALLVAWIVSLAVL